MNPTTLEPHRLYWVRAYLEARAWRKGMPEDFKATKVALDQYIKTLRQNWAIERRWEAVYVSFYQRVEATINPQS